MTSTAAKDIAALCWINPFSLHRSELEAKLMGDDYQAISLLGGDRPFSRNIPALLRICDRVIETQPACPEYSEVVAFIIYHRLISDLDQMIHDPKAGKQVWRSFQALWEQYFQASREPVKDFDPPTLFSLFYQVRRAFHWIFRYVIGSGSEAIRLRARMWESIFSADLKRYVAGFHREMKDVHTLITGPSGTGKSIVARAIGMSRFIPFDPQKGAFVTDPEASFLSVNIAALPEQLLESELFGHVKGAFTGAIQDRAGLFESTGPHGALFLDEIGEAETSAQAKLLTVLQDRRFRRLGESHSRFAQGRVITATNRDLEVAVAKGLFREDLYFRLSADRLEMVALRDLLQGKIEALQPMVDFITRKLLQESWSPEVVGEALQFIEDRLGPHYQWPGNFRELEQCLRNFLIHRDYRPINLQPDSVDSLEQALQNQDFTAQYLLGRYARALYRRLGNYKAVGEVMGVDQRTAKKYLEAEE